MATNPLFNALNGTQQQNNDGFSNLLNDFQRLSQTVKNPKQEVQRLLQSGAMSQQQFNQFSNMANQLIGMVKK